MAEAATYDAKLRRFSGLSGAGVALLGIIVLAGWALEIDRLKRVVPGLVAMNPATAAAFILAGIALLCSSRGEFKRRAASICALVVTAIGLLKLASYVFGWPLPIDQLLFSGQLNDTNIPNRMAPNTALNFFLSGLALLWIDVETKRGHRPAQVFALAVSALALLALTGYAFGADLFYRIRTFIPMAVHTAGGFLLLSIGILCARPNRGLIAIISSDGAGGVMARRLLPAAIAVPVLLGWLRLEGEKAGYYDRNFGVALMAVSSIIIFGALVFWNALSLERADAKRKEAERDRQKSAEEQERFFTLSLDLLCIAGFDGYFKRMNPAWEKVLGFSREELLAKPFIEFVHPNDRAATEEESRKLTTGGAAIAFGNRYRCKDGSYRRLLWNAASLVEQGLIYAVARDVTEQKQAEEILRQSEERTRLIVDTAYDAFVAIDAAGYITGWNRQAETTFGWSRDEAMGRKLAETIIPAAYRERHERGMKHFRATGEGPVLNQRIELAALHRDGREFPVELTIWPIQVGDTFFFNAFLRDITERKRAEEKIKHLNEDLEHRASLLETANKELEAFSYSVSHDLRAPLRHIDGYADLVCKGSGATLDETGRRYLATISESAKQMGRLIDDLLVFSRMGRAELRHAPVDLNALAEETINVLQADVNGRNVEWKKGALPKVTGDAAMLRQVFVNLLSNAVKYTGPRDPALIEIGCTNGAPDEFVVFVRDNGVGFDMEYAGKLFGVFQRLHNSDDFEGTGIGLANVRRIIQRHGGRTWAEGKVDAGSTFYFSLPKTQQKD